MNTTTGIAIYCNVIDKLPKEFVDKNAGKVLTGALVSIAIQYLPEVVDKIGYNFRYWVDARYGIPDTVSDTYEEIVDSNLAA